MSFQPLTQQGAVTSQLLAALNSQLGLILPTQGQIYWVKPNSGSDSYDGLSAGSAFKTLLRALQACTANQNDVVLFCAESNTAARTTDYQAATLDWNKDLTHLIGVNSGPFLGQRSRISNLSSAAALNPMVKVSANGCLISGLEFFQGTPASGTTSVALQVTGQRNVIQSCQISGNGDLTGVADVAGSRSLLISGSENTFKGCYIGLDTVIRATQTSEVEITAGARNYFEACHFESYTSLSTFKAVVIATGCDRWMKFKDCDFTACQNITSATAPTGAIGITTMNGQVFMKNPYVYGYAQIVTADNAYVQVLGLNGLATGHLIGIAQGVDAT